MTKDTLTITPPTHALQGRIMPPGSKSITNRALLLAGLAKGVSKLAGALKSDDTLYMAYALRAMGVVIEEPDHTTFIVHGNGGLKEPENALFLGNAGTATRFLTAAVAMFEGTFIIDGDEHMQKRPISPLVHGLSTLGVDVLAPTGCPPVTVWAKGGFTKNHVTIDAGLSSQYVSALLMAAACGREAFTVELAGTAIGARGYITLTTACMEAFGAKVHQEGDAKWIIEPTGYKAADYLIEPDASAATYLWAMEVLTGGKIDLGVAASEFSQPDARSYDMIAAFPHMPGSIDGSQMQDAIPTLAVLAAFNNSPVRFTGIENLRVKECDRIRALSLGLNNISAGLAVEEGDDLIVNGNPALAGKPVDALIDTFADHRIAMSFALAGLKIPGIKIENPSCVAKTYPGYWDALASLGVAFERRA
ncbi:3-phosphoshikimate 1-carboxyvinyltransferase [Rhizobium sp. L1K21]|uniref:3-phosphoshikimate 1-carboxyvinyltransferase n=1 Tax=Rhizobium sp. L1K21 TaxID=2954933 RepID=UPI002092D38E|nr:3-phosphoshikimate 1-carboxyvinyltransferase [Rhizobium sp. L1K21]MCO6186910.1 3-phosphoshikimate 1-carboxyvinyltransferase [Rhizobium sp. L1K21]